MCSLHNRLGRDQYDEIRFDFRWTVVVDILRIGGINIVSTTVNNVGTSSSFKDILAPG